MNHFRRRAAALAAGVILPVSLIGPAFADTLGSTDFDEAVNDKHVETMNPGDFSDVKFWINATGGNPASCDAADGSPATITLPLPSGFTASSSDSRFTAPNSFTLAACGEANGVTVRFAVGSGAAAGEHTITPTISDTTGQYGNGSTAKYTITVPEQEEPPSNLAPVVTLSGPATVAESTSTQRTYAFTIQDDAALAGSATASCGGTPFTVSAAASGSFTCVFPDGPASPTVSISYTDGGGLSDTEQLAVTVTNVAPTVDVTVVQTAACAATVGMTFTDPAEAFDDDYARTLSTDASIGSTTYAAPTYSGSNVFGAGTTTVSGSVTDKDGGEGTDSADFVASNVPSGILAPINTTGTRSSFKIGSTIPVKITVADCDGNAVSTLAPTVKLFKLDGTAENEVNEVVSTATPTSGTTMRWSDSGQQYIYNLSTKNSQFANGGSLSTGTYRIEIHDASFFGPVTATAVFDVKK